MLSFRCRHRTRLRHVVWRIGLALLVGGAGTLPAAEPGQPLADVLDAWRRDGLAISFSTALITDDMRVTDLPDRSLGPSDERRLKTLLAPHGLSVESPIPGHWWVVPLAGRIRGRVVERSTGQPVARASVTVGERRTVTDAAGRFTLTGIADGRVEVIAHRDGFRPYRHHHQLEEGRPPLRIALEAAVAETVHVDDRAWVDALVGSPSEPVERAPTADPLAVIDSWLGVDARDGTLSIRGDREGRLAVVLDGHELWEPYHLRDFGALVGRVASVSVGGSHLHLDWLPPSFGERSDAVLELLSREPSRGLLHGQLGVDESAAQASLSGRAFRDRVGWLAAYRHGRPILADELAESSERPAFSDGFGRVSAAITPRHHIVLRGLWADDDFLFARSLGTFASDQFILDHQHDDLWGHASAATERRLWEVTVAHSRVRRDRFGVSIAADSGDEDAYALSDVRQQTQRTVRGSTSILLGEDTWHLGAEVRDETATLRYEDLVDLFRPTRGEIPELRSVGTELTGLHTTAFATWRRRHADGERLIGLRVDRTASTDEWLISPRWSESRRLQHGRVYGSLGLYHRAMRPIELSLADGDLALAPAERSARLSLGVERSLGRGWTLTVNAHAERVTHPWPRHENLFEPVSRFPEIEEDRIHLRPRRGDSVGLEVGLRYRARRHAGRLDYRLGRARDHLADGATVPRDIDRRHRLRLTWDWRPSTAWSVSMIWSAATGAPDTPVRFEGLVAPTWVAGPLYTDRLPTSHRLDVAATYAHRWRGLDLDWRIGIDNLTDHEAVRGYETTPRQDADGAWRLPPELGLGLTPRVGLRLRF